MLRVVLAQVTQRQNVSRLVVCTAFVRYPHLYSVDRHAARYVGQRLHGGLVVVAEEVTKEEVPVLVVTVNVYLILRHLCAAFAAHTLALRVLLRHQCLHFQLAELQSYLHAEQRLRAADKTAVQIHRNVTAFYRLDNIVLLAFVRKFQVLLVKTERRLGVVVQVEVQLVAYLAVDRRLDLLVKVEDVVVARTLCQRWVVDVLVLEAE